MKFTIPETHRKIRAATMKDENANTAANSALYAGSAGVRASEDGDGLYTDSG